MAETNLQAIQTKIRRITRSPSPSNMTNDQLNEYINTFISYDMPQNLRLFTLRTVLTFYTQPGIDVYESSDDTTSGLYDFKNRYTAVHAPVFMLGVQGLYTQDRTGFYNIWPQTNFVQDTQLRGTGSPGSYVGTLPQNPILQNNLIFTTQDALGAGMVLIDYPVDNVTGLIGQPNAVPTLGTINYLTGAYSITFPNPTAVGSVIFSETIPYKPGRPTTMLFYDNKFTLRPVPDNVYSIQIEADITPLELLDSAESPQIKQWWQYIALGASLKVFEDRGDFDSIANYYPLYAKQELLVQRPTLQTAANERTQTIFTMGKFYGGGWFGGTWPY